MDGQITHVIILEVDIAVILKCKVCNTRSEMNSNPERVIKMREYSFHLQRQEIYKQKSFPPLKILSVLNLFNSFQSWRKSHQT